jgi:transcriptional regulator with XRE-family HTH domain
MALFFDAEWFDARLAERGLNRRILAAAAGMSEAELTLVYKDQRELSVDEVATFAEVLGTPAAEVARQAGVSTPVPGAGAEQRIIALERRVAALEAEIARLKGAGRGV